MSDKTNVTMTEDERKNAQVKKLYIGVIILLIVMFVGIFVYSLNRVLALEGAFPDMFSSPEASVVAEPLSADDAIALLNEAVSDALEKKPAVSNSRSFSINDIESTGSAAVTSTLEYIKGRVEGRLENSYKTTKNEDGGMSFASASFGGDTASVISLPEITGDTVKEFSCTYIYYRCASCGETSDEPLEKCDACGYAFPYTLKNHDEYTIEITLDTKEAGNEVFGNKSEEDVISVLSADNSLDGFGKIDSVEVTTDKCTVYFKVNRITGQLTYLEYKKDMKAEALISTSGDFEKTGDIGVTCTVTEKNKFNFTWPGLSLNNHTMDVEPNGSDNLLATLSCDDATAYEVKWTSSDESVVTVDSEGYFKGKKEGEGKTAEITASFVFDGVEYSDFCLVTVQYSAEEMRMNKKNAKLDAGETIQLKAIITPKNATFKNMHCWISSDETVATVDENGLVTAVSSGTAVIAAYSADGYLKSTCEVTVK